jgi:hypothetical protein
MLDYSRGDRLYDWRFGDWDCDVLFLMQDAAPCDKIAERVGRHPDPFSARNFVEEPRVGGAQTNRNLHDFASRLNCRKLAGSAFIAILKPGEDYSGPVEALGRCPCVRGYRLNVLRWTLEKEQTPNLRAVVCLGAPALEFISEALALEGRALTRLSRQRGGRCTSEALRPCGFLSVASESLARSPMLATGWARCCGSRLAADGGGVRLRLDRMTDIDGYSALHQDPEESRLRLHLGLNRRNPAGSALAIGRHTSLSPQPGPPPPR